MWYPIIIAAAWLVWHLAFRIKVVGKENLIRDRGFVLTPNHISAIDPVFVAVSRVLDKRMIIMAKQELFNQNWFLDWFFKAVNIVAIERGKGDNSVIEKIIDDVKKGQGALIFPEGTRTKDGNLGKLKSGAFVIASKANVDIIPCRIIYKGGKMKIFGRCTVVFGKPLTAEEMALNGEKSAARLRECKAMLTKRLEDLLEENKQYA